MAFKKFAPKVKRSRKINIEKEAERYIHCTPEEAVSLSKTGTALGYDLLRWGEKFHETGGDDGYHAASATAAGIRFFTINQLERDWINDVDRDDPDRGRQMSARRKFIESRQFYPWGTLSPLNRDFIYSLLWVPEVPMGALEALALAAEGDK